eukprot:scaffold302026_cov19-Tisochrysis_lutea.AAC.1
MHTGTHTPEAAAAAAAAEAAHPLLRRLYYYAIREWSRHEKRLPSNWLRRMRAAQGTASHKHSTPQGVQALSDPLKSLSKGHAASNECLDGLGKVLQGHLVRQ